MKKKKMVIATLLASCITVSATFTGCSLVSTISKADMEQVVAEINISASDTFEAEFKDSGIYQYKNAITSSTVLKRELISYFLNVGYQYVANETYTYEQTFTLLMDALVENAVLVQYSTIRLLEAKAQEPGNTVASVVEAFTASDKSESEKYEYLLGENSDEVKYAKYRLYSSLNSAIDNYEKTIIEEESGYTGTDTRTTPTNLDTEQDNYYPKTQDGGIDYYVYTGYKNTERSYLLEDSGIYKDDALEGTTRATRVKAYNSFINSLRRNNLIDTDAEGDKLTDVLALSYVETEYVSQLESRVINKYYDLYEEEQVEKLKTDNYIDNVFNEMFSDQEEKYDTASAFESAMDSMSSSSFILYSPDTSDSDKFDGVNYGKYGFVYNILLPFSAKQSARLSELSSIRSADEDDDYYYYERNKLLKDITTEDQRSAWFNGETDYSFKVSESELKDEVYYGASDYLFFENNLTDSEEGGRYKKLEAYDGRYSYNGTVLENEDGSYTLVGKKLDIDGMLAEFSAYINFVLSDGADNAADKVKFNDGYTTAKGNSAYYTERNFTKKNADGEDEIDYSKFLYASGSVNFDFARSDLMNPVTDQYKAMSAVNELQFAYTTDTSVLSQYIGYSVSAYDTSYIKEFEYAAKKAISDGAGSFAVCAGDYGWHLIYVTFVFDSNKTYEPDWTNIEVEGTFENLFFEWIKDKNLSDVTTTRKDQIISDFNKDSTVTRYQKRYQELLDLGK